MLIAMPSAPKKDRTEAFQRQFLAHIRNPRRAKRPPGVNPRRMGVYNELLFNNIEGVLAGCFPVLKQVMGEKRFRGLARDFFAEHRSLTPFFRQVPDEFIAYLKKERKPQRDDPPFLKDLAHYEWIELDLFVSDAKPQGKRMNPKGDLLKGRPALCPALCLVSYPYEVHRIGPSFKPKKASPEPFRYLVFRNPKDEVQFIVLNALTARLIEILRKTKLSGEKALRKISKEMGALPVDEILKGGAEILRELREKGAILGTFAA